MLVTFFLSDSFRSVAPVGEEYAVITTLNCIVGWAIDRGKYLPKCEYHSAMSSGTGETSASLREPQRSKKD